MIDSRFWEAHRQWLEPPDDDTDKREIDCIECGDELKPHEENLCRYCKELQEEEDV